MQHTDYTRLVQARELLSRCNLPLETSSAPDARDRIRAALRQLDDYVLPRISTLDAPLTVVVGGSTGAGKSTLVNSLLGEPVTLSGAIRPTTRQPVLLHRPDDSAYLQQEHYLPHMRRHPVSFRNLATTEESTPGGQTHAGTDILATVQTDALPRGIALIDAPDIDSVSDHNRRLAKDLLAAADLWLFVTTANRYADAVPWELLHRAAARNITVAIILNRVPEGDEEAIETDLRQMLAEAKITPVLLVTVPEQPRDERGLLPAAALVEVIFWLRELGANAPERAAIARRTLAGAVAGLSEDLAAIAAEQEQQDETRSFLRTVVKDSYAAALEQVEEAASDGSLLRGEVLVRWQDFVGTAEFFRSLESGIGRLRDRMVGFLRGRPAEATKVEQALEHGLHAVTVDAVARAAKTVRRSWGTVRPGIILLESIDEGVSAAEREAEQHEFEAHVSAAIRAWQQSILEMVREEGAGKRQRARVLSFGVNAAAVLLMVGVFSATGGLTGLEVGIAGGSGVIGTKLLESIFGEDAARRMAERARIDLLERMRVLLDSHSERFMAVLEALPDAPDAQQIRAQAQITLAISRELAADTPVTLAAGDEPVSHQIEADNPTMSEKQPGEGHQ